ncbi:TlpA family protein disulfide reductase [Flavihumibacter sediminis]|nr:TlpA family protein disulfide reductase [Flavihumibacter sediminis]
MKDFRLAGRYVTYIFLMMMAACNDNPNRLDAVKTDQNSITQIQLTDMNGKSIDLASYKGKPLFINIWATWCKPCLKEMPSIEKAQELIGNENMTFLFASNENMDQIKEFIQENKYNFTYTRVENAESLGIEALPTTLIFNANHELVFFEPGYRKWDDANNLDLLRKTIAGK